MTFWKGRPVGTTFSEERRMNKEMLDSRQERRKGKLAGLSTEQKNDALLNAMADALVAGRREILAANALDMAVREGSISARSCWTD